MMTNDLMAKPILAINGSLSCYPDRSITRNTGSSIRDIIYLNLSNVRKMIKRFLHEKEMSKKELASSLDISVKNIDQLFYEKLPAGLMSKVNLPLVRLYCSTKW